MTKTKFNFKRFFQVLLLVLALIPSAFIFSACSFDSSSTTVYVVGIEQTGTTDTSTIFTVTYSNGKTTTFTIENGEDGEDVSIESIFNYCVSLNLYDNSTEGFQEFLSDYLSTETDTGEDLTQASYTALKSAVNVYSIFTYEYYDYQGNFSYYELYPYTATGSGVVYSYDNTEDGYSYIVTCYHVLYSYVSLEHVRYSVANNGIATQIYLTQYGDDTISFSCESSTSSEEGVYPTVTSNGIAAEYIGGSIQCDIAVLKVKSSDLANWTQEVALADDYSLAETVIAVGNPEGEGFSVTSGIVDVYSEEASTSIDGTNTYYYRVLRTDTAINGGNSGGGLFNAYGELVGIVNLKLNSSSIDNMAYAIPVDKVVKIANNIIDNYEDESNTAGEAIGVTAVNTGITTAEANMKAVYDSVSDTITIESLCVVYSVEEASEEDGTTASIFSDLTYGDIITEVTITTPADEGTGTGAVVKAYTITREYMFSEALLDARVGDTITITYTRSGETSTSTISYTLTSSDFYSYI